MQILMTDEAHKDMESIFEYISRDSVKYANKTIEEIYLLINRLENSPYIGRCVLEIATKNFRELFYKNYRIVYEIFENSNYIYIHFIIHKKRNLKSFYKSYLKNNF